MSTEVETPTPDVERLRALADWVEYQAQLPPDKRHWDQSVFYNDGSEVACGTAYCVAGKVALDDGYKMVAGQQSARLFDDDGAPIYTSWGFLHADTYAQKALGLTFDQGEDLFAWHNTAEDIRRIVEEIVAEAP